MKSCSRVFLGFWACTGQNGRKEYERVEVFALDEYTGNEPLMIFDALVHDFGTIIEGEQLVK